MEEQSHRKRGRDESEEFSSEMDLPEVKKIRENLLGGLDESDPDAESLDLDSVMKSFEEEISASSSSPAPVIDLTSESGESQPELGYLLEASDDELGLPPSSINSSGEEAKNAETELVRVNSAGSSGIREIWGLEDTIPSYDSFDLDVVENYGSDFVAYDDGLLDYSNVCFDSCEYSDYSWRLGSMPE